MGINDHTTHRLTLESKGLIELELFLLEVLLVEAFLIELLKLFLSALSMLLGFLLLLSFYTISQLGAQNAKEL